jgi:hypothetical protein
MEEQTLMKALNDVHVHIEALRKVLDATSTLFVDFEKTVTVRPDGKHVVNIDDVSNYSTTAEWSARLFDDCVGKLRDVLTTFVDQCDAVEVRFDATECPRCGEVMPSVERRGEHIGAISRLDNMTEICTTCGCEEAFGGLMAGWHRLLSSVIEGRYRHAHPELSNVKGA